MDWDRAIERNSLALLRIVGALFGLLVVARISGSGIFVPRHIWRKVLIVLRPAEAALRRLIIIAARGFPTSPLWEGRREAAGGGAGFANIASNPVSLAPIFQLFDPLKSFSSREQETSTESGSTRSDIDDTPVNAQLLFTRLRALRHALADLPKQARRLARFNARRDALLKAGKPTRTSLTRPGLPPGWHARGKHEIDTVLHECHRLAQLFEDST